MADDLEKTETPTPKRIKDSRDKGQVAVSTEVFTVANLLGVTLTLMLTGTSFLYMCISTFRRLWVPRNELDIEGAAELLRIGFAPAATVLLPILLLGEHLHELGSLPDHSLNIIYVDHGWHLTTSLACRCTLRMALCRDCAPGLGGGQRGGG